jgi:hypothetical protein
MVYCSRRCQKQDWRYGGHRQHCEGQQQQWQNWSTYESRDLTCAYNLRRTVLGLSENQNAAIPSLMERFFWQRLVSEDITVRHDALIKQLFREWYEAGYLERSDVVMDYRRLPVEVGLTPIRPEDRWTGEEHSTPRSKDGGPTELTMRARVFFTAGTRTRSMFLLISRSS